MAIKQDVLPVGELESAMEKALAELQWLSDQIALNHWELLRLKVRAVAEVFSTFSSEGVLFVSQRGLILYADKMIGEMFGYTAAELVKQQIEMLIPPEVPESHPNIARTFMGVNSRSLEAGIALGSRGVKKDGTEFKLSVSLTRGEVEGERMFCLICTALG
jgi:PAS domain S-box-containing protein